MTEEQRNRLRTNAYFTLIDMSGLPKYVTDNDLDIDLYPAECDVASFNRLAEIQNSIYSRVTDYKLSGHEKHLMICSEHTGNGKTSWAMKLLLEYCWSDSGHEYYPDPSQYSRGVFISTTKFILASKEWDSSHRKKYWDWERDTEEAALVVFDDIGTAEYTRAEYVALLAAIDYRIFHNKMCIFTSNFIDIDEKSTARLGNRLADRIFSNSEVIELRGKGKRH